jgi:HK97 gp10 family phage protein
MSDGIQFKLTGVAELARALEEKPPIVARRIISTSVRKAVQPWREEMIARVRRGWHLFSRTGIKGLRGPRGKTFAGREREFGVIAGSIVVRAHVGASGFEGSAAVFPSRRAFWARFLEFGTRKMRAFPFIRPAFETRKEEVLAAYIADVREQLAKDLGLK